MEVKDMKGILAGGYFYQGASFAQKLSNYGTENADAEFDNLIVDVLKSRMNLTSSVVDIDDFAKKVIASENQAYYNSADDYDNSIVWWGGIYDSGEEDEQVQVLGFADNDTVEYIEEQRTAGAIPEEADYVCRSYFFYGEAGGANPDPDHEYLYFMVRIQRELNFPYRETVVISAPASLLSMEKVLVTETFDEDGNPVYTATVEHEEPARVVYEVGLWDTITAENVSYIVSSEYADETVNGEGSVNYDADTDTYSFFTNDWERTSTPESHNRAQAKATFDAAADNAFYTYQEDTLIVDANGIPVTSDPAGTTAYYVREYYEWPSDAKKDGTYSAIKKTMLIEVELPENAKLIEIDGKWYIPKGAYTAATLVVNGDDTVKSANATGTSSIVAHPHRTGDSSNSHYTVYLGNNGKLSLVADPYEPEKTVSVNLPDTAMDIVDDDGKAVKVGDELTYTVEVKNVLTVAADITVSDYVPLGTAFVEGSAGYGTSETGHTTDASIKPDEDNVLTWILEDVPAGETRYVSFKVTVTEAALSLSVVTDAIDNTAHVYLNNYPVISTNTTYNPPYGKSVTDVNNQDINGVHSYKVGDTLVYHIRFHNNATDADGSYIPADVTVSDKIPEGTTFLSADNGGSYDAATGTVTWTFDDMAADTAKVVSFRVKIDASAKIAKTGTQPAEGEIYLPNTATIEINNDPDFTLITNTTENWADVGDMILTKQVAAGGDTSKTFTVDLTESTGLLEGTYAMSGTSAASVEFKAGKASVSIKHGETLTIKGLPAGVIITVEEDLSALPGWTPTYNKQSVTIVKGEATAVSSVSVINAYTLQPLNVTLKGVKNMNGILPVSTTFGFVAEPDGANPVVGGPLTGEVTVKASGEYEFTMSSKTFTQPGEYKYTVSEIPGGVEGVTYDSAEYVLIITVIDNGDGTMSAEATLDGSSFDLDNDAVTFTNAYTPDDAPLTLVAEKTLKVYDAAVGEYVDGTPTAGQFRFRIAEKGGSGVVTTGTNAADGTITFNTFYFSASMLDGVTVDAQGNKSKDFTFVVSEVVPELASDPNMLYDLNGYEFTATLTYTADGVLSVSVGGDSDGTVDLTDTINFVNYDNPDSVEVRPVGTKTTDDAPAGVTFSFSVINTLTGNEPSAGVGDANGNITFSPLSFTEEGTYTYWIKESNAGNTTNGITYDAARYLMKVVVTRNSYNRLVAEVTYLSSAVDGSENVADYTIPASAPAFHNEYNAGGYINLTATKSLSGRDLSAGEFAFKLIRRDNNGEIDGIVNEEGKVTFSTLYYSEKDIPAGSDSAIIHYVMSEVIPATAKLPGVTYDTANHDVYVRITDNGNGTITPQLVKPDATGGYTAVGGTDTGVVFNNSYTTVNGDEIKFYIRKTLNGRDLREGEFDFQLFSGSNPSANAVPVDIATNDANGMVTFTRQIPATAVPDTYTFTIKEAAGSLAGVTYDKSSYTIYVKITDDGKGNIVAQLVDAAGDPLEEDSDGAVDLTDEIVFVNTYVPGDAPVQLEATKELSGRPMNDKEFSFVVRSDDINGKIVATGSNDAEGKILFSTFDITSADMGGATSKTFKYVIAESDNIIPGVTVDDTVYTVTVTVTDDGTGSLKAQVNYPNGVPVIFKNAYAPAPTDLPLVAFKTLNGKNLAEGDFTFELKNTAGTVIQSAKNNDSGVISFDNLKFTADDMVDADGNKVMTKKFVYTLTEKAGDVDTMVYDSNVYTITVTVTDDGEGNLTAAADYTDVDGAVQLIRFTNSYTPPVLDVELEGTKSIADADGASLDDAEKYPLAGFEFEVRDTEGDLLTTARSDENGNIKFTGFSFTEAGEYRFLVSEKTTDRAGYATDPTVWCVHVTVGYDADTGLLFEAGEFVHLAPETHSDVIALASEELSFVNTYDPADVTLALKVKKDLDGRDLRENEFTFYVEDASSGLRVAEARNNSAGEVSFRLNYTDAGVYDYVIREEIPTEEKKVGGVSYTKDTYKVTVTVTDDGKGALQAQLGDVVALGDETIDLTDTVIFSNTYTPDPVDVTIEAFKRLDGKKLEAETFTFELVNKDDATDKYTATNATDGKVIFDKITYSKADVYEYTLSEVAGSAGGVTYDTRKYTVVVTVTDDGNGKLRAVTNYTNNDGAVEAVPVFVNSYKPAPVDYIPEVKKIYEGGDMLTFDFVLTGEGFDTQIKQNNTKGEVTFDALTFSRAGSYTFTIEEQADASVDNIKWDANVYTLTIEVIDNGDGQLKIDDISITSDNGRTDLVFRNVHEDLITDKEVFVKDDITVNIDGKTVETGDVLTYTVSYKNYTGKAVDVTITDIIPQHTEYVEGSADNGGTLADGTLTWTLTDIAPDATVTVSFDVVVTGVDVTVDNTAQVLEGTNTYETNSVSTPVKEDEFTKDVFSENEPEISIDGKAVNANDILLFKITYTNSDDLAAEVTITDVIPEYTTYVDGSADNDGEYAEGKLTWKLQLGAGESKTVSFKVKVNAADAVVTNQATAVEGDNEYTTNVVTTPVNEDVPEKQDEVTKDVSFAEKADISIDGKKVYSGDTLVYAIGYKNNSTDKVTVTITDVIPEYTTYVDGSADNDGVYADGKLTWMLDVEAGETVTVSFKVIVDDVDSGAVTNTATVVIGDKSYTTNEVSNPVGVKDVIPPYSPIMGVTGDIWLLFALMFISGTGFIAALIRTGKKKAEK